MRDEVATVVTDGVDDTRIGRRSSREPSDPRRLTGDSIGRLGPSMNCNDSFANEVIGPALLIAGGRCGIVEDVIEAIQGDLADAWGVGHTSCVRSMPRGGKGSRQSIIGGQLRSHHVRDFVVVDDPCVDVHGSIVAAAQRSTGLRRYRATCPTAELAIEFGAAWAQWMLTTGALRRRINIMEETTFKPKRGSLVNAVTTILGHFTDKSAAEIRLQAMTKAEWKESGIGNPLVIPFQTGATDHCYALRLVFCEGNHPLSVSVHNYFPGDKIEEWVDELWRLWDEGTDEYDNDDT